MHPLFYSMRHGNRHLPAQLRGGAAAAMRSEPDVRKLFLGLRVQGLLLGSKPFEVTPSLTVQRRLIPKHYLCHKKCLIPKSSHSQYRKFQAQKLRLSKPSPQNTKPQSLSLSLALHLYVHTTCIRPGVYVYIYSACICEHAHTYMLQDIDNSMKNTWPTKYMCIYIYTHACMPTYLPTYIHTAYIHQYIHT